MFHRPDRKTDFHSQNCVLWHEKNKANKFPNYNIQIVFNNLFFSYCRHEEANFQLRSEESSLHQRHIHYGSIFNYRWILYLYFKKKQLIIFYEFEKHTHHSYIISRKKFSVVINDNNKKQKEDRAAGEERERKKRKIVTWNEIVKFIDLQYHDFYQGSFYMKTH